MMNRQVLFLVGLLYRYADRSAAERAACTCLKSIAALDAPEFTIDERIQYSGDVSSIRKPESQDIYRGIIKKFDGKSWGLQVIDAERFFPGRGYGGEWLVSFGVTAADFNDAMRRGEIDQRYLNHLLGIFDSTDCVEAIGPRAVDACFVQWRQESINMFNYYWPVHVVSGAEKFVFPEGGISIIGSRGVLYSAWRFKDYSGGGPSAILLPCTKAIGKRYVGEIWKDRE